MNHTMWKSMKNCAPKWCCKLCAYLFKVTCRDSRFQFFRFRFRFQDCLVLEPGSDSSSETVQVYDSIPIPVLRPNMPRTRSHRFQSDSKAFYLQAGIPVPIPIPGLPKLKYRFRFRFQDYLSWNIGSDSETIPIPNPRVSVFRFRDERTGNLWSFGETINSNHMTEKQKFEAF